MFSLTPSHVLEHAFPWAKSNYVLSLTTKVTLFYFRNNNFFLCMLISDFFFIDFESFLGLTRWILLRSTFFCLFSKLWLQIWLIIIPINTRWRRLIKQAFTDVLFELISPGRSVLWRRNGRFYKFLARFSSLFTIELSVEMDLDSSVHFLINY